MAVFDANYSWQPIETAPELDRVMVCGWQKQKGTTIGYWWYEEDVVSGGVGIGKPHALFWAPLVIPPFPAGPA